MNILIVDILSFFSSSVEIDFLYLSQIGSILTSTFSSVFGLVGIYGYKAFYYYEQKRIKYCKIGQLEKELLQKIGRFISLFLWYLSVLISRILLISLIVSTKPYLISILMFRFN